MLTALLVIAGLALSAHVAILLLADLYLIVVHLRASERRLAEESARITAARPAGHTLPTGELPLVCVQLPVFDEPALVGPAIDSLCRLDWPRDRLEIMVLDDSTDATSAIAAERVAHWRQAGFDIYHRRRGHRRDFKAGALAEGMRFTDARYLAVFDVDYQPPTSFLRHTMAPLLADRGLAFVQARLDYRNRDANRLTRAQALELDTTLAYEQAARNWAGIPMSFNGTCGVWRRQAIDEAGGWSGRSLAEDQDLSFRAFARGWRCLHLVSVRAEGELPESFGALARQRQRWSTGTAQAFRDLPWGLLRRLGRPQAAVFVLLALFHASTAAALGGALLATLALWLVAPAAAAIAGAALLAVVSALVLLKSTGALLAARLLGRPLGFTFAGDVVGMWLMEAALLPIAGAALLTGYLTRRVPFLRTPKRGASEPGSDTNASGGGTSSTGPRRA